MRENHLQIIYMSKLFKNHIFDKTRVSIIKNDCYKSMTKKYKEANFKMGIEFEHTFLQKRYVNIQKAHENIVTRH